MSIAVETIILSKGSRCIKGKFLRMLFALNCIGRMSMLFDKQDSESSSNCIF